MGELASPGQLRAATLRWALVFVPLLVGLGFLVGQMSGSGAGNPWFDALVKPATYPPPALFGIVWGILYAMMGVALAQVVAARGAAGRGVAIAVFVVQFAVNLAWSPVFFAAHRIDLAIAVIVALDLLVILTMHLFRKVRPLAAWLLVPYLLWALFATVLTIDFYKANPDAAQAAPADAVSRVAI